MTPQEFETLTHQYLDNEISPEDLARLKEAIESSELLRMHFNQACKLHLAERRVLARARGERRPHVPSRSRGRGSSSLSRGASRSPRSAEPAAPHAAGGAAPAAHERVGEFSLRDLQRVHDEHKARMATTRARRRRYHAEISESERIRIRKSRRRTRLLRSVFPLWICFVFALMMFVIYRLPTAVQNGENEDLKIDTDRAQIALADQPLALPSIAPVPAPAADSSIAGGSGESKGISSVAKSPDTPSSGSARAAASAAEPVAAKPVVEEDLTHVTALIPTSIKDMARTGQNASQGETQSDLSQAHLEKALKEIFETTAY